MGKEKKIAMKLQVKCKDTKRKISAGTILPISNRNIDITINNILTLFQCAFLIQKASRGRFRHQAPSPLEATAGRAFTFSQEMPKKILKKCSN